MTKQFNETELSLISKLQEVLAWAENEGMPKLDPATFTELMDFLNLLEKGGNP